MAKRTVSFDKPLVTISGEPMPDGTGGEVNLGKTLADHISGSAAEKNVVKLYSWAVSMFRGEVLVLDSEDFQSLKQFIELLPRAPIFVKAQAIEIMNESKAE